MSTFQLKNLELTSDEEIAQLVEAVEAEEEYKKWHKLEYAYPDEGPYARDKYKIAVDVMDKGKERRFRVLSGGNRSGKSFWLAYEIAVHMTGQYPHWWTGKRFKKMRSVWIVAETGPLFRDSLQKTLFGEAGEDIGTGLLPLAEKNDGIGIIDYGALQGTTGGIGTCTVKHKNGQTVSLVVKTNEMKREVFQAAKVDIIAFDEEPRLDIYNECMLRLMSIGREKEEGIAMLAFTPLKGLSEVLLKFLPNGQMPEKGTALDSPDNYIARIEWEDVPHLSEKEKKTMIQNMDAREIESRTKGIPALGSGRIYPVDDSFIIVPQFKVPEYWPRCYGLDFGWHATAVVWIAQDPNTKIKYVYGEYKHGKVADYIHVGSIKARGDWIPGACDPSGGGRKDDGTLKREDWAAQGLKLAPGINAFLPGTAKLLNQMEAGLFKVMDSCQEWIKEYRVYRYDVNNPNSAAPKQDDHLLDATRYADSIFDRIAISEYDERYAPNDDYYDDNMFGGRDPDSGY